MGMVIGIIVVLAVAAFLAFLTCKSKSSDLYKWVGIAIFIAFALTWAIPYGYFQNGSFMGTGEMRQLGLTDIPNVLYYGIYFGLTTIIYLLVLGGFYGVITKTKSYQALVKKTSKFVKGKEIAVAVVLMILLIGLTSIVKTPFVLLVFIPFLVSVLLNAKFDKITTMGLTFGSVLVGTLAATYGTEGLYWFNSYLSITDIKVGLINRVWIASFALVLFVAYNIYRVVKMKKKNRINDLDSDLYAVEDVKEKKVKSWPTIVIFAFLAIILVLGYVDWNANFGIECFNKFHEWFIGLSIGDFQLFHKIIGNGALAFGSFELATMITILLIVSLIIVLMNRMKLSEYVSAFADGIVKIAKPTCLFTLTYVLFMISYMNPFMASVSDWAFGLTKNFNPFITTITAFVTSVFHADLGYTAYVVGSALSTNFAGNFDLAHTLYVATYGLAGLALPTGSLLLVGLSYLKIDYKSWFKYIWIFAAAMLVVILTFSAIVTYAM